MTFDYYVYTQGEALQRALNAIAAFFQSASFGSITGMAFMIGAVMTLCYFYATRNPSHLYIWAAVFVLVPSMLLTQTARVQIIDKTEPSGLYPVDNVPYLVALPTWFFSSMMVGATETIESLFTTVDDERYGRTGMLFGSELFMLSRQADLRDVNTRRLWDDFFRNCLIGDIEINKKYTWNELLQASDIFAFLDPQSMSPLRGVMKDGLSQDFKTCREIYPEIKDTFTRHTAEELNLIATYLHGKRAPVYRTHVTNSISNSYDTFIQSSSNTVDVLRQNMAMNALRHSVDHLDPSATAMNYAYTSNKMQQTAFWAGLGLQAREFIPMLHTMFFFLFSCLGCIVAAVALIPALTRMVLVNYVKTFAYLATWPILFAFLNAIMLWALEGSSMATANPLKGLSMSNANALDELHQRFAWMTGVLMMCVPAIAGGFLKGGVAVASAMTYSLANMINSTNARTSAAVSTGNLDFGNLQMQNYSMNNLSANKFDDNMLIRSGMATVQQPDGSSITLLRNHDGERLYNAQEAISKPAWGAQVSSLLQNSVNDQYSSALTAQKQHANSFNDAFSTSMNTSDRWNSSWSHQQSYGDGHSLSTEGQIVQSHSQMTSAIDNVSQTMGWTQDQARAYMTSASAGITVGTPEFFGSSAKAGINWSQDERSAYHHMSAEQKQALEQATQQYSAGATAMERASRTLDTRDNRSEMEQYAHDFALNHQRLQTTGANVTASNAEVDNLSHLKSRMESDSVQFTQNAVKGFKQYLNETAPKQVDRLMNATTPDDMRDVRREMEIYTHSEQFQRDYGVSTHRSDIAELGAMYHGQPLNVRPTLMPEQQSLTGRGAQTAQATYSEVVTEVNPVKGGDALYDPDTYRNVKGNTLVAGGQWQNEASERPEPTPDSGSGVRQAVMDEVERKTYPSSTASDAEYPQYNPPKK
ncbi:conjugal transfer protein TraG N-terminal domain-containing protein [Vibrio mimicus]|uniref:conjugal transfer protein TraG N-terminal domain-containing protein n=1 Tax=Vibrio mimicus TaxID=674 RepID=UPI002F9561B6